MNDQLVTLTQRWVFPLSPVLLTRTGPLYRCCIFHFKDLKTVSKSKNGYTQSFLLAVDAHQQ